MLIIFPCMRIFILQKLLRRSLPIILMAIPTVGTGFFLYGKIGDQSIIFPQTSSKGQTELQTREMDLSGEGENETVYFGITAEGAVGDKIGIGYYYMRC